MCCFGKMGGVYGSETKVYPDETFSFFYQFVQMHHPIQMKPADSEKNNGKDLQLFDLLKISLNNRIQSKLPDVCQP